MKIFETKRLVIKSLERKDLNNFIELFSAPKIIDPIPAKYTKSEILDRFNKNLNLKKSVLEKKKCACGIFEKGNSEMIGLCLFLTNDENEKELGYRFRVNYWGKGYGTETIQGIIDYYFNDLNIEKITADVNIENVGSVKILNKFMKPVREIYNKRDNCTDRRYEIERKNWL